MLTPPDPEPDCYVTDFENVMVEFGSRLQAQAYIDGVHDYQEDAGVTLTPFSILPCIVSPGGRDIR